MTIGVRRISIVVAAVAAAVAVGSPAFAHVEVEADKAQAGARDVTLTFTGEAESVTAGIKSERVVLPQGIAPADVTLVKAPKGWKMTTAADGFTISGAALGVGDDAVWAVKVAQLPTDRTQLAFKTLESYSDGKISRWIELQQEGQPEPDNPAPTLKVKAAAKTAAPTTTAAAPSAPAAVTTPPSAAASSPEPAALATDDEGSSTGWWVVAALAVVAVLVGVALTLRRRRGTNSPA